MDFFSSDDSAAPVLRWWNVCIGFSFTLPSMILSNYLELGIGTSFFTSCLRCVVQLGLISTLLKQVLESDNPWVVAGYALVLNLLSTFEVVSNRLQRRHQDMFKSVLTGMLGSTILISITGVKLAMSVDPFWSPIQYIPITGMLCGSTMSAIVVAVNCTLRELKENRDKVEVYLTFGATRMEACRPIVQEALKLALTPVLNQMSVMGIIAIPGMMTGAILGGSSIEQAAKRQIILMFMITSCSGLAAVFTAFSVVLVVVDASHRIRSDRIEDKPQASWQWGPSLKLLSDVKLKMLRGT